MDSEVQGTSAEAPGAGITVSGAPAAPPAPVPAPKSKLHWVFIGPQGLRSGWSAGIFVGIFLFVQLLFRGAAKLAEKMGTQSNAPAKTTNLTPAFMILGEGFSLLFLLIVILFMALLEHRHPADYNLRGTRSFTKFLSGLAAGFAALSALIAAMYLGGWIHFGPVALSGWPILSYGALWGIGFLLVGLMEEGMCRCYLQFTLTRGINFWWALAAVAAMCTSLLFSHHGQEAWGTYSFALLGLFPCLLLHLRNSPDSSFWYAAWATSTYFGWIHTSNTGENWIGIFQAAAIGFVFCVSVWATGSAWWAIGCHAAWDWAESYFYGTADSGLVAKGHLLNTTPAGSALWNGGADGPEGSLLMFPITALLLLAVIALYGRRKHLKAAASTTA